jgi:hypothetical protein
MTSNGLPDCPRTSRYILKDYVNVSINRIYLSTIQYKSWIYEGRLWKWPSPICRKSHKVEHILVVFCFFEYFACLIILNKFK